MNAPTSQRWELLYNQVPLQDVPRHYAGLRRSPFLMEYLTAILKLCPQGERTLETGIGSGYGAVWLSLRGCLAEGIDTSERIVERTRLVNNILSGKASFRVGDLFQLREKRGQKLKNSHQRPYAVIHHQGVLEHFPVPWIHAALSQQVALANWVVFSVPSVYYGCEPEFGDERLLPIEEWERILSPFSIEDLRYSGEREHVLCVLKEQEVTDALLERKMVPEDPYPDGISAIVHTRNEARHIAECLQSLQGWTDEIIVCDMESEDDTLAIARQFTENIVLHPRIENFDRARNVSAMRAKYRWVFYLDADERVPPGLGPALKHLLATQPDQFEALLVPFRHFFAGHILQCLYPGYTAPRLFKNGTFVFNARPHSGAQVDGRIAAFPADNPDFSLLHYSYDNVAHHLDKLNRYTDTEAANMHKDGRSYDWHQQVRDWVHDLSAYYDQGNARQDGPHGWIYAFQSGGYRFTQHAKLFERRFFHNQLQTQEMAVPASIKEFLTYALAVLENEANQRPAPTQIQVRPHPPTPSPSQGEGEIGAGKYNASPSSSLSSKGEIESKIQVGKKVPPRPLWERGSGGEGLVWSGPLTDPSGYGEESRNFVFALEAAGVPVAAQIVPWSRDVVDMPEEERRTLQEMMSRPVAPGFAQIIQNFPPGFARHPEAGIAIGRTMFETDRLPQDWVKACNRMDFLWVPSEFNRQTFAAAGVAQEKLVVMPGCLDPMFYRQQPAPPPCVSRIAQEGKFVFLTVFDWTLHKGWDVLLQSFLDAFDDREDVLLVLKVWSTLGYSAQQIQEQAIEFIRHESGRDLLSDKRVCFLTERLSREGLLALYQAANAFVLPSRGEGWGRPYMEAMACGLPTIGTGWSGNTAFMNEANSYLLDYELQPVPKKGWQEIPTYRGHCWAEPDREQLKRLMRQVCAECEAATEIGRRAQEYVTTHFCREVVGQQMIAELAREIKLHAKDSPPLLAKERGNGERVGDWKGGEVLQGGEGCISVRWEGAQFVRHSLAHVNREFCLKLIESGRVELALAPTEPQYFHPDEDPRFAELAFRCFAPLSKPAQAHIRHCFPPRFERPEEGKFVLIQPWEYGFLPHRWIEPILRNVDEVWCYSRYVKDVYRASGIPEEKLQVVPLGVDVNVFHADALPYIFTNEPGTSRLERERRKRFTFLYVGGTIHRKGIDILLDAYLRAFSAFDDVCLVIKDMGTNTVYRGANERERILSLVEDRMHAPIVYIENDLSAHQLAGLYASCDCLAQPYRGEGFCLPALEAMACGLPVIAPEGGPTDDFVDETVGWRIPAEKRPYGDGRIGDWDCVGPTWAFEVSSDDLACHLRRVYAGQEEAVRRGHAAAARAREGWTWDRATTKALERLEALQERPVLQPASLPARAVVRATTQFPEQTGSRKKSRLELLHTDMPEAARSMPTISLCMIVRNEERVLGDCLASIKPWVDEMIVVDTGSTDNTIEIAESFGAKIFCFPWRDDFSAARNESIRHASGDWIFWMDADDTIPEECGRQLHDLALMAEDRTLGIILQVHIPPKSGEYGYTVVDHVKLFRNLPSLRFEHRIHEQILEPIYRAGGVIERSQLFVVHSGYDYSPEGQKKKRERDLRLLTLDERERPNDPFTKFNVGMTAFHRKEFDKATEALECCLQLSKPWESTVRKVYAMLCGCYLEQRDLARARQRLEQGLRLFPRDPELLFRAGVLYTELGDLQAAEQAYTRLLTEREAGHIDSLDVSMTSYKAHHNLAAVYQQMGRMDAVETHLKAAVTVNPGFVPSLISLRDLYLHTGRQGDAQGIESRLAAIAP